jgi:prevent-host-death family protein
MYYSSSMSDTQSGRPGGLAAAPRPGPHTIGIRELRQHASVYVDLAEKGQAVDITNRGRLVARLVPAAEPDSPLDRLVAAGVLQPAEDPGRLLDIEPAPPVPRGQPTASQILLQMREAERY